MPATALTIAVGDYGHTRLLKEASVRPQGLALQPVEVPSLVELVRRMARGLEFDIAELSLSTYMPARTFHTPFTAIPVFPLRSFCHSAIVYRPGSGISTPSDLNGRRVGVNRGWTVTTGVWARAILASEYGVDLSSITWVTTGDDHVQAYVPPANVVSAPPGTGLAELLAAGEIDAAVGVREAPGSLPLSAQPQAAERGFFEQTGVYPINHTVVVKDEVLQAEPGIAEALFSAFTEAKERYLERLHAEGAASPQDEALLARTQFVGPDPLPYGIEPNRVTLDALIDACVEQQIIPERVSVEELFRVAM